jgi:hypothetical protein
VEAFNNGPEVLTKLLQQSFYLPDKSDVLAEGKKPFDVLATAYKKFLDRNSPPPSQPSSAKVAKTRERASSVCQAAIKRRGGLLLKRKRPTMIF